MVPRQKGQVKGACEQWPGQLMIRPFGGAASFRVENGKRGASWLGRVCPVICGWFA